MARKIGQIIARGNNRWLVRVSLGRDHVSGKRPVRDRVCLHGQIECLLEEMRIKLSVVVTDLFGASGLRILHALVQDETDLRFSGGRIRILVLCAERAARQAAPSSGHAVHWRRQGARRTGETS